MMNVLVRWTEHDRQYTIPLEAFLKLAGINVTEIQLKKVARHLLEQQELKPLEQPKHQ